MAPSGTTGKKWKIWAIFGRKIGNFGRFLWKKMKILVDFWGKKMEILGDFDGNSKTKIDANNPFHPPFNPTSPPIGPTPPTSFTPAPLTTNEGGVSQASYDEGGVCRDTPCQGMIPAPIY